MKTIIKYELVINKALRSALNYDTPDEHRESYNLLKAQNVKNLVVCPIHYKDEIKGFFGVDNPPESDTLGLTTFPDMIGTLLTSQGDT